MIKLTAGLNSRLIDNRVADRLYKSMVDSGELKLLTLGTYGLLCLYVLCITLRIDVLSVPYSALDRTVLHYAHEHMYLRVDTYIHNYDTHVHRASVSTQVCL